MPDTIAAPEKPDFGGVWPLPPRLGRPKPYGVQWREWTWDPLANGGAGDQVEQRKTEFFTTEALRDARATKLRQERARGSLRTATRAEIEDWRSFRAAVGETPWQEVVAGWRSDLTSRGLVPCIVTVDDAVKRELARVNKLLEMKPPQIAKGTVRHKIQKLGLFKDQFGHLRINQVKGLDVETWIEDFDEVQSNGTFNNYLKQVRVALQPYVDAGMLPRNPVAGIKFRDESTGEVGINTPQESAALFAFAMKSDRFKVAIGRFALEAFVGLRFSSGCRLEKSDLNFEDKGILLPKRKLKTGLAEGGRRHYIDGVIPGQVWEWLAITPDECWQLDPRQYERLKCDLFTEAKVAHPHNAFRHSFCTYDVAVHKNAGRTAYILCHTDQDLIWSRYKGVQARGKIMTEADGKVYQSITPETAEKLAEGYVPPAELMLPAA
jgi:integrase